MCNVQRNSDQFKLISLFFNPFADMILLIYHCVSVPELLLSVGWYSERPHLGEYNI